MVDRKPCAPPCEGQHAGVFLRVPATLHLSEAHPPPVPSFSPPKAVSCSLTYDSRSGTHVYFPCLQDVSPCVTTGWWGGECSLPFPSTEAVGVHWGLGAGPFLVLLPVAEAASLQALLGWQWAAFFPFLQEQVTFALSQEASALQEAFKPADLAAADLPLELTGPGWMASLGPPRPLANLGRSCPPAPPTLSGSALPHLLPGSCGASWTGGSGMDSLSLRL